MVSSSPSSSSTPNRRQPGSNASLRIQTSNRTEDDEDNHIDLLMRHSSPIDRRNHPNGSNNNTSNSNGNSNNPSPITIRNSSPSPIGLSRPRSNPRNRTPMRYESPMPVPSFRIPEEDDNDDDDDEYDEYESQVNGVERHSNPVATTEGRRITILRMAGSARGTNIANFRVRTRCC